MTSKDDQLARGVPPAGGLEELKGVSSPAPPPGGQDVKAQVEGIKGF